MPCPPLHPNHFTDYLTLMHTEIIDTAALVNLLERTEFEQTDLDGGLTLYRANINGRAVSVTVGCGNDAVLFCRKADSGHVLNVISKPLPHLHLV